MINSIIIAFLPIYFIIAFDNPKRAFLMWVFLSPFTTDSLFQKMGDFPAVSFDRLAIGIVVLSLALGNKYRQAFSSRLNKLEKWMLIFICVLSIELLFAYRPKDATARFLNIVDVFGIPFIAYYITKILLIKEGESNRKLFNRFVSVSIVIAVIVAVMGIYEGITLNDLMPAPESDFSLTHGGSLRVVDGLARVNGPYFTPETFGVVLSMLFFMVLYKVNVLNNGLEKNKKAWYLVVLGAILVGIYFNMFRSIWLGLALGLTSRFLLMPRKRAKMIFVSMFLIFIMGISWADLTSHDVYKNRVSDEGTFYNRVGAWLYCLRAFSEDPLAGIGYGKIYKYIEHAQEANDMIYVEGFKAAMEPHQTFLSLLAENGILGLLPFLLILLSIVRYILEYHWRADNFADKEFSVAAASIFVAYFVPMFFDKTGYYTKINNLFYVFVGMMMANLENLRSQTRVRGTTSHGVVDGR